MTVDATYEIRLQGRGPERVKKYQGPLAAARIAARQWAKEQVISDLLFTITDTAGDVVFRGSITKG